MAGSPTIDEKAATFAELLLEGKTSPAQLALTEHVCSMEPIVTADMEWWAELLRLAFKMGHASAVDSKTGKRAVRK